MHLCVTYLLIVRPRIFVLPDVMEVVFVLNEFLKLLSTFHLRSALLSSTMFSSLFRVMVSVSLLSLFGAGCLWGSSEPSSPAYRDSAAPSTPALGRSACDHPYYPLRRGYSVTFKDSYNSLVDGRPTTDRYTWSVTDVGADSATLDILFASSGLHSKQTVSCAGGSLFARAYVDLASSGRAVNMETTFASGEYLPRDLAPGSRWQQKYAIAMRAAAPARPGDVSRMPDTNASVTIDHEAVREESVTVPSGTYTAVVVKSHTEMKIDAMGGVAGAADLPGIEVDSTEWWVRGVGLVKAQTQMAAGYTATAEAETIVIP